MTGIAIVTGTSAGIGAEVARQLVGRDWTVVGVARRDGELSDARYRHITLDLADANALTHVIDAEIVPLLRDERWTRVGLVNNAATALLGPLENTNAFALATTITVNLAAPMALMAAVSRHASHDVPLRVVNVSTGAATAAFPGLAMYGSAKAGLRMAGMVLATEWESTLPHAPTRRDAALLSYEPGVVDTAMQDHARSLRPSEMPWVGTFEQFKRDGWLVPPARPAADIVAFLESNRQPTFAERRLGT